jgi:integrase
VSLYRRKNSPHYWCRFQLDGREIRISTRTGNRAAAQEFETLARNRTYNQIRLGHRPAYPWTDASARWLRESSKRSKDIDERIIAWISAQVGTATVQEITREVIEELRALKAEEQSQSTADRYMALLRSILRKCESDWQVLDKAPRVPMYRPERPEPRWLTPAQFRLLEKHLPAHLKHAARFAVLTGLRMRAMLSLTWDQVDMAKGRAWIAGADMKGKDTHGFPLSPDAVAVLRAAHKRKKGEWIFHWRGKRAADCNGKAFKDAVKAAKLEPLRWHDLRHTWASWAVQSGATLHEVMKLGAWRSLAMVMRYSHLAPDHLSEAAAKVRLSARKPAHKKRAA